MIADKEGDDRKKDAHRRGEAGDKKEKKDKKGKKERHGKEDRHERDPKAATQRYKLVQELLTSERAHGENLTSMVTNYLKPLSEQAIISKTDITELFCNIELLRNWSVAFREGLEEHLGPKLDGDFGALFEEMEKTAAGGKDLLSYLYLPIQRILAYEALLKEILELTTPDEPDFAHLTSSLQQLRDAEIHANNRAKLRKNIDKVLAIQNSVSGVSNLALPHRRFIYESELQLVTGPPPARKERFLYLFNDILLCARTSQGGKKKTMLEVAFIEPLETLKIEDVEDTPDLKYAFKLISPANEYIFSTNYYSDKTTWSTLIRDTLRILAKTRTAQQQSGPPGHQEEFSRDSLVAKILAWSKKDNAETVLREVKEFAALLEKKRP